MQKTAYELRISVWSSDVCSSDLEGRGFVGRVVLLEGLFPRPPRRGLGILGRAVLEEVGVLDAVEDGVQPAQRVLGGAVDRLTAEQGEAAAGAVAAVGLPAMRLEGIEVALPQVVRKSTSQN